MKTANAQGTAETVPTITMRDFFALERVRDLQRCQKQSPYGSKMHRWAHDEIVRLADSFGAREFIGEY